MNEQLDLNRYFERIGYNEIPKNDIQTLKRLNYLHTIAIPFENLNPILKIPVHIDIDSIQHKLVKNNRGGYCYEHNILFYNVLQAIGFELRPLAGRVVWNMTDDTIIEQTHMLLMVTIDNIEYIVDVGFGGLSLTTPVTLILDEEQKTTHEPCRIIQKNNMFFIQTKVQNDWKSLYSFIKAPAYIVDFNVANWYTSTYPEHIFTNNLTVARADEKGRYALSNNKFRSYFLDGKSETRIIKNIDDLKNILTTIFKIKLPNVNNLDDVLSGFVNK